MAVNQSKLALRPIFARGGVGTNSLLTFASLSMQFSSNAILVMVLAWLVNVDVLGEILYAKVFANIAVVMASYGFENLVIREVSQGRYSLRGITSNLILAKVVLSTFLILICALFISLVPIPLVQPSDLWFYLGAALVNSFALSLSALRKGKNDFATDMQLSLFSNSLLFIGTLGAILVFDPTTLLIGQVRLLTRLVAFVFALGIFVKRVREEEKTSHWQWPQVTVIRKLLVIGFPFGMQALLGTAYFQIDVLVLGALKTSTEVSFYQGPMQLVSAAMLLSVAINHAYYPRLAQAFATSRSEGLELKHQMIKVLTVFGIIFLVLFSVGSPLIITIVYGTKMEPGIQVMRILSILFLVRSVAGGMGASLMAIGLQKITAIAGAMALTISLGLNLLLIPVGGGIAVAWVNVLTNLCVFFTYLWGWREGWKAFCSPSVTDVK